jgi:hypothetical protein
VVAALVVGLGASERIDAVVLGMAAVPLDPVPFDPVRGRRGEQFLPQLGVLDRLPVGGVPAVLPPLVDPAGDSVANVIAVGMELDPARALQRLQAADRGDQLHPVIGGQRLAAGNLALLVANAKKRRPAPRARIAPARAIGENFDLIHHPTAVIASAAKQSGRSPWIAASLRSSQ